MTFLLSRLWFWFVAQQRHRHDRQFLLVVFGFGFWMIVKVQFGDYPKIMLPLLGIHVIWTVAEFIAAHINTKQRFETRREHAAMAEAAARHLRDW